MYFPYWIIVSVTGLYSELEQSISQIQAYSLLRPFLYSYDYLYYDQNTMRVKSTVGVGGRMILSAAILKIWLCQNSRSPSKMFSLMTHNTPTASVVLKNFQCIWRPCIRASLIHSDTKKRELLKNPRKIEEIIKKKKIIDRNWKNVYVEEDAIYRT